MSLSVAIHSPGNEVAYSRKRSSIIMWCGRPIDCGCSTRVITPGRTYFSP